MICKDPYRTTRRFSTAPHPTARPSLGAYGILGVTMPTESTTPDLAEPARASGTRGRQSLGEHAKHGGDAVAGDRHDRLLSITEAVLLSLVAVLAAYSGYAAAKWGTESSVSLAKASTLRTKANRADLEGLQVRTLDSVSFSAW